MPVEGIGNYGADSDISPLEAVEEGTLLPGTSFARKILSQDNPTNTDTNYNRSVLVDPLAEPTAVSVLDQLGLNSGFSGNYGQGVSMSSNFNKVAWIMDNGEPQCTTCDRYYTPSSMEHVRIAHCNPLGPEYPCPGNEDGTLPVAEASALPENADEGDYINGAMIRTNTDDATLASRLASTDDYLELFQKQSSDSSLFQMGIDDYHNGKPLNVELAEVSDDYFHGYEYAQIYKSSPQASAPQNLYDIKPNSNMLPRAAASKTANVQLEQEILEELEKLEQAICGREGCNESTPGMFNGQPHCLPGQGCCCDAQEGGCPNCGNSFHGFNVCGPRGCAGGMSLNAEGEDLATILRHDAGHDDWHRSMGQEPCTDEADCAAKAQEHKNREHLNPLAANRRFNSSLPIDVINKFFEV